MSTSFIPIWSNDPPVIDQTHPQLPKTIQPPVHFTHVLGPLLRQEKKFTFDETKACNSQFYDLTADQVVTPLAYLLGFNQEHKVYHKEAAILLTHPDLDVDKQYDNLFKYLVRFPSPENIKMITMLVAYRRVVYEGNITSILTEFSKEKFSFDDKCNRELAVQAFAEMLKAPVNINFKKAAQNQTTPLLAALRIPIVGDEKINPFTQLVLQTIKTQTIKQIISGEITNEKELKSIIRRMAGNPVDKNYQNAIGLLSDLVDELLPCVNSSRKINHEDILLTLTSPAARAVEAKQCAIIKSAIDTNNLEKVSHLIDIIDYDDPERILNYILKKNDDSLYGMIFAIFNGDSAGKIANNFVGRNFSRLYKKLPKIGEALFWHLFDDAEYLVSEFRGQCGDVFFEIGREQWQARYKEFLIKFLELENDLEEFHWRFLIRAGIRHAMSHVMKSEKLAQMAFLNCADLRDYARFIYEKDDEEVAMVAIQQVEQLNGGVLCLEDLFLLSRANFQMVDIENLNSIEKLNYLVEEICCLLRCELIAENYIAPREYQNSQDEMLEIINHDDFPWEQGEDTDRRVRQLCVKLNLYLKKFLEKGNPKVAVIYPFVVILLKAIVNPNAEERQSIAVYQFKQGEEGYLSSLESYLSILQAGDKINPDDEENILFALSALIQSHEPQIPAGLCDRFVRVLFRKFQDRRNKDELLHVNNLLARIIIHQEALCEKLRARKKEFKPTQAEMAGLELMEIHLLLCRAPADYWKKIRIKCRLQIEKFQMQSNQHQLLFALNYYCGVACQKLGDFEHANIYLAAANALLPDDNDCQYARAECLYLTAEKKETLKEDREYYLNKALEYLKEDPRNNPMHMVKKMVLMLRIHIFKIKLDLFEQKEIEKLKKALATCKDLCNVFPEIVPPYIETNIQLGCLTQDENYFTEAMRSNPFYTKQNMSWGISFTSEQTEYLMLFVRAHRYLIQSNPKYYTDKNKSNIFQLLEAIDHIDKEHELSLWRALTDKLDKIIELKNALITAEQEKAKTALLSNATKPHVFTPSSPLGKLGQSKAEFKRMKGYGEGVPAKDSVLQTSPVIKPKHEPDPERKRQRDNVREVMQARSEQRQVQREKLKSNQELRRENKQKREEQRSIQLRAQREREEHEEKQRQAEAVRVEAALTRIEHRLSNTLYGAYRSPMTFFGSKDNNEVAKAPLSLSSRLSS